MGSQHFSAGLRQKIVSEKYKMYSLGGNEAIRINSKETGRGKEITEQDNINNEEDPYKKADNSR